MTGQIRAIQDDVLQLALPGSLALQLRRRFGKRRGHVREHILGKSETERLSGILLDQLAEKRLPLPNHTGKLATQRHSVAGRRGKQPAVDGQQLIVETSDAGRGCVVLCH